ncbi:YcaO-like family protein [Streptomyces monashensis]|uniref:YcaO domain-containing protein n=1 Tax=Streptomyces monashensis TaxID=1678012 RepID=A0A1S2PJ80_9ACTN|nr:YcaO-like family protein [Streptomyces monashensis]OIJ93606.1 hypothetical protein BIV23_37275 [Streptomyces monashensis]
MIGLREKLLSGPERDEPDATALHRRFQASVDSATGLFNELREEKNYYNDDHDLLSVRMELRPTASLSDGGYRVGPIMMGRTDEPVSSASRAMFEGFERYSLSLYEKDRLVHASPKRLAEQLRAFIDVDLFADVRRPVDRDSLFRWVAGLDLATGAEVLVPAQAVYVPYAFADGEQELREPLTTGAASGLAWPHTLTRALHEIVERDATMLLHYGGCAVRLIEPAHVLGPRMLAYTRAMQATDKSVTFAQVQTDLPAHVVVVVVEDPTGRSPAVCVGSGAAASIAAAAESALCEAAAFNRALRSRLAYGEQLLSRAPSAQPVTSGELRGYYWAQPERVGTLSWFDGAAVMPESAVTDAPIYEPAQLVDHLVSLPGGAIVVDCTPPDVRSFGVYCLKALVPALQPMHLDESCMIRTARLQERIVGSGSGSTTDKIGPHPFL